MCGRFQISCPFSVLVSLYRLQPSGVDIDLVPRLNIAPTSLVPIVVDEGVVDEGGRRVAVQMRWGFPAMWLAGQGKDPWSRALINAKVEEAHRKRTWARALRSRRCLVPATGFYEWARRGRKRYPLLFSRTDGAPMAMAGIHGDFDKDGQRVTCFAVLTTGPGADLGRFHDRGPVILDPDRWDEWLDPDLDAEASAALLQPVAAGVLGFELVNTAVNNVRNQSPELEADWSLSDLGED